VAADFISRRALAPVFDGKQKSAARLSKHEFFFRTFPKDHQGVSEAELNLIYDGKQSES